MLIWKDVHDVSLNETSMFLSNLYNTTAFLLRGKAYNKCHYIFV